MLLAIVTTISFQEMAVRVGLCTNWGLSEAILQQSRHVIGRFFAIVLIISAIFIGNAMYEAGNISGAILGVGAVFPEGAQPGSYLNVLIAAIAFVILYIGKYRLIERTLVITVALMAVAFIVAALASRPEISKAFSGLFVPRLPDGNLLYVVGLIGTTVVPYNLFLHASAVKQRWKGPESLPAARWDTVFSVALGGLISIAIIITASAVSSKVSGISNASDMARVLEPAFGPVSRYAIALGLFAAGLSSSITAPMGAAYAISGLFQNRRWVYQATWMIILVSGLVFSLTGFSPVAIIKYAQVTNGLLLPIIALFLILTANSSKIMTKFTNSLWQNLLAGFVLLIAILIAYRTLINIL